MEAEQKRKEKSEPTVYSHPRWKEAHTHTVMHLTMAARMQKTQKELCFKSNASISTKGETRLKKVSLREQKKHQNLQGHTCIW